MSIIKSESISKLVSALAIAKTAFNPVLKLSENPGFKRNGKVSKYADLATAIDATEDALLANGLVVAQFPVNDGERVGALTILTHVSGEYMGESFTLPLGQQNAQAGVAAVTYARRTGYLAALSIASEDDDGQTVVSTYDAAVTSYEVSRDDYPDFQDAKRGIEGPPTQRPTAAVAPKTREAETPLIDAVPTENAAVAVAEAVTAREPGDEEPITLPTEIELTAYRTRFNELANELSAHGQLTASKGLKLNTKLLVFFLSIVKADAAKHVSVQQWDNFFERTRAAIANPEVGLIGLTKLINKANGLDTK